MTLSVATLAAELASIVAVICRGLRGRFDYIARFSTLPRLYKYEQKCAIDCPEGFPRHPDRDGNNVSPTTHPPIVGKSFFSVNHLRCRLAGFRDCHVMVIWSSGHVPKSEGRVNMLPSAAGCFQGFNSAGGAFVVHRELTLVGGCVLILND